MGGATSLIEATALGRRAIGVDISSLAAFLARAKTTPLSREELEDTQLWLTNRVKRIKFNRKSIRISKWETYQRNIPWRIRKIMELILHEIRFLKNEKTRRFVRCILLKTGQGCLDCNDDFPNLSKFLEIFENNFIKMRGGMAEYVDNLTDDSGAAASEFVDRCRIIRRSAIGIDLDKRIPKNWLPPKLVLTSPPYPGVHAVYHRWQVRGRKETPAPFWLANQLDGKAESFYTLGSRFEKSLDTYFDQITSIFRSISKISGKETTIVQLVAFSDLSWQFERYLKAMTEAGFKEWWPSELESKGIDRIWRTVPNRKWYTRSHSNAAAKEVVLFHKLS